MDDEQDVDDALFEVQCVVGLHRKNLEALAKQREFLTRQRQELVTGLRKANEHKSTMKQSLVVMASEWGMVAKLRDSFSVKLKECEQRLAETQELTQKTQEELKNAEAEEARLITKLDQIPNNILEFPRRDIRRSEETS